MTTENQTPTAQSGPSDRAIAQAFREWKSEQHDSTDIVRGGFFHAAISIVNRAESIDQEAPPAGARDAVTDAMVERACRAICVKHGHDPDERTRYAGSNKLVRTKEGEFYPQWKMHEPDVRTALEATALTGKADDYTNHPALQQPCKHCGAIGMCPEPFKCVSASAAETQPAASGMGELLATWRAGLIDAEKRGDEGYIAGWKDCMQGRIKDLEALAAAPVAAGGMGDFVLMPRRLPDDALALMACFDYDDVGNNKIDAAAECWHGIVALAGQPAPYKLTADDLEIV